MESSDSKKIAITGDPGSGKTTFARSVARIMHCELVTTGNIFRELAAKKGISITDLNRLAEKQKEIDYEVDNYLKSLNDDPSRYVLDSRMAWYFVKDAFKVRLYVDPAVAVRRILLDKAELREKYGSYEEAQKDIEARKQSEIKRYHDLYKVDISDNANFDLVIDTSNKTIEETTQEFLKHWKALEAEGM